MRCDQCKHWKRASEDNRIGWEAQGAEFGECTAVRPRWVITDDIPSPWMQGEPSKDALKAYEDAKTAALKAARAYVQDGSDYVADLVTGPDFGCVLFEQQ